MAPASRSTDGERMHPQLPVAVLVSGRGSNLAALIRARDAGTLPVRFVLVASNNAAALALRLAEERGIPTLALEPRAYLTRAAHDQDLFDRIAASGAKLVVLAGFMRILDDTVIAPWAGRIINIHPSLLPKYRGLHTHRKALAAGDREHGASVHFVTGELDGGPVIAQAVIAVHEGDDEASLAARLLEHEHRLLPAALALIASGRVDLRADAIIYDGKPLKAPLRLVDNRLTPA
jgi:phosphoribosylglycinamide formyltransferase-1